MRASPPSYRPTRRAAVVLLLVVGLAAITALAAAAQTGRLFGRVVDQDGEPVAGVTVHLRNEDRAVDLELETDEDGRFSRTGLEPGLPYQLRIEAEGYLPVRQQIRVEAGGSDVQIRLQGGRAYAEARYQEGYRAYEQSDFQTAAETMADVVAALEETEEPGQLYLDALVLLGFSSGQVGDLEAAEAAYRDLIEAAPEDSRGYFGLGGIHANQGDVEAAIEQFERAVELAPQDTRSRFALGAMYVEAQRWEDAIPPLETALEAGGTPPIVHLWLGNAYGNTGRRQDAIDALETYLELAPDAPEREQVETALEQLRQGGDEGDGS